MPRIFVSYRRNDSQFETDRIVHELQAEFGDANVFMDKQTIPAGVKFKEYIQEFLSKTDIAIAVIGKGWLEEIDGELRLDKPDDFVRLEIETALKSDIPVIPLLLDDTPIPARLPPVIQRLNEHNAITVRLSDFDYDIKRLIENIWRVHNHELQSDDTSSLSKSPTERRIATTKLPRTGEHLVGREAELERLNEAWSNKQTTIVQIVAPGGVGKTQLIKKWREQLIDNDGGTIRVFDYSFYSQGTQQEASSDDFFKEALQWFGEKHPERYKGIAKGEQLAKLVKQQRTLLILDGMEPLQYPPGPLAGDVSDPPVQALLEHLQRDNPGLCVVTTRESVTSLNQMSEPKRQTIDLNNLTPETGAVLLTIHNVQGDEAELQQASIDVDGHALTLILLGTLLEARFKGDVSRRDEALRFEGHEAFTHHASKVMASYEMWFIRGDEPGKPPVGQAAVAILRMMGLFNRVAEADCLAELRSPNPIRGLTEPLFKTTKEGLFGFKKFEPDDDIWIQAVERLRRARLLADEDAADPKSLDAHPLIREHFANLLAEKFPKPAAAAHARLYAHLKASAPELPLTADAMKPLYNAVTHGCKANEHRDVAFGVLWGRILQGLRCYSMTILGLTGSDLVAMANLFHDRDWTRPHPNLQTKFQAEALSYAGLLLLQMNRLDEALVATKQALKIAYGLKDMACAGRNARHISQIYIMKSDLQSALDYAQQYRVLAQRPCGLLQSDRLAEKLFAIVQSKGIWPKLKTFFSIRRIDFEPSPEKVYLHEMASWTGLAHVFHLAGKLEPAAECFEKAEEVQRTQQAEKQLHSIWGYRYWELLFDLGKYEEIRERCTTMLTALEKNPTPIWGVGQADFAFAQVALVRANIFLNRTDEFDAAQALIEDATRRFSESLNQWAIPDALLVKAELAMATRDLPHARIILEEAEKVSVQGKMIASRIGVAVAWARLAIQESQPEEAQQRLTEAADLIAQHEKKYQPNPPNWKDWEPPFDDIFKPGDVIGHQRFSNEIEQLKASL